jgi:hypothetical protein
VARAGLAVLLIYVGTAHALTRIGEARVAERFPAALQVQANVVPGEPLAHRYVVVEEDRYRILTPEGAVHEVPRTPADAIVRAALESEKIRGFANWTRFPYWSVEEEAEYWLVTFRDLRYRGPDLGPRGIGFAEVKVRKND